MDPAEFYATVCRCSNTSMQCPGVVNSRSTGWPPRGFFTEVSQPRVALLAVCKNPGHLLPNEAELYMTTPDDALAKVHMHYSGITFKGGNDFSSVARRSTTFHKNLLRYISFILDVPASEVFRHIAYTNLVKCSGIKERDPLAPRTMKECFRQHFVREIAYFRPKVLLAFGREVEGFLVRASEDGLHTLPVVYMKHPSYFYRREREPIELQAIKARVRGYTDA